MIENDNNKIKTTRKEITENKSNENNKNNINSNLKKKTKNKQEKDENSNIKFNDMALVLEEDKKKQSNEVKTISGSNDKCMNEKQYFQIPSIQTARKKKKNFSYYNLEFADSDGKLTREKIDSIIKGKKDLEKKHNHLEEKGLDYLDYNLKKKISKEYIKPLYKNDKEKDKEKKMDLDFAEKEGVASKDYLMKQRNSQIKLSNHTKQIEEEDLNKYYIKYKNYANKNKFFIILFIIGMVVSLCGLIFSSILQYYGNKDIYIICLFINILLIVCFTLGIVFIYKNRILTLKVIDSKGDPEKIELSKERNNLYLFFYILTILFFFNIFCIFVNTINSDNVLLDIRGKGYDINKWNKYFENKEYLEVVNKYKLINTIFICFGWVNIGLIFFILAYSFYLLNSYRSWKRIGQVICIMFVKLSFLLIYLSEFCLKFRNITSLDSNELSWAIPGTFFSGLLGIFLGFFGFFIFFFEKKKLIFIFNIICISLIIFFSVFAGGIKAVALKLEKKEINFSCNSLFKFIFEDYLLYNNECTSKYLFSFENLTNVKCPKERIMINWELSEKFFKEKNSEEEEINKESNNIIYGCINQSCCLKTYFKIKNIFECLEILTFYQLGFVIILFVFGLYLYYRVDMAFEEEIRERVNILILFILLMFLFLIVLIITILQPSTSKQSQLNKIKELKTDKDLSIIDKNLIIPNNREDLFKITNNSWNEITNNIIINLSNSIIFDYEKDKNFEFDLSNYEYNLSSKDIKVTLKNDLKENVDYFDLKNEDFKNGTKSISFKSKSNIINTLLNFFYLLPYHPLKNKNELLLNVKANYTKKNFSNKNNKINKRIISQSDNINENNTKYSKIIITKEIIESNYNLTSHCSLVSIINEAIMDFSIMDKNNFFYLTGNIINDNGSSLINLYNYFYNEKPLYSVKTNIDGTFNIGPLFKLCKNESYELNLSIFKINLVNIDNGDYNYKIDENYIKYNDKIIVGDSWFHQSLIKMKDISLPQKNIFEYEVSGYVFDNEKEEPIKNIYIRLFSGNKIIQTDYEVLEQLEEKFSKEGYIGYTTTSENGKFSFKIKENGQYTIIYVNENYFLETQNFVFDDSISSNLILKSVGLVKLFNAGKIVVKLEWENKPPDLDLFCRFKVSKNNYCYTFFGNQACVKSNFYMDIREGGKKGSEIISIDPLSKYIYFFYVRKYFDVSNGLAQNEYKIKDVDSNKDTNYSNIYITNDDSLNNSFAKLSIYSNGLRIPAIKINIPNELNEKQFNYIYWGAFCINGNEGLKSLKIVNKMFQREPPNDICLSYYEKSNIISFP